MKKYLSILLLLLLALGFSATGKPRKAAPVLKPRVEPTFWWTGMQNPRLQLMVHGENIGTTRVTLSHQGVRVTGVTAVENPNYLFIDLDLSGAVPGKFDIQFLREGKTIALTAYELKQREPGSAMRRGFNSSDAMYLVMPDRFANGDPGNDAVEGMMDKPDRTNLQGRQGGDIKGLRDHLDYISGMGFTAIWLNPLLENDMPATSYHGYATTDFYKVDPRYGTNEEYRDFARVAREKGIKLIMDMIFNHCGLEHWWMKDMPMADWINQYPDYQITNHVKTLNQDPYAASYDKNQFVDGWFVPTMPDLNQRNPFMATYLIQNSIWWIEYAHLAGIRMDTYPYPDKEIMAQWNHRIREEYPDFNIVGEEWHMNQAILAYWMRGKTNLDGYSGDLRSLMDFPLQNAVSTALRDPGTGELMKIYECLANDFQYPDPKNMVVFPDNHDMTRFFVQVNRNYDLLKMGIGYFLTTRGIPQIYYGTEIAMNHTGTHDSEFRKPFPGGWAGDTVNAFTGDGLSPKEKEIQQFLQKLLNWRKEKEVIHTGKLRHFLPFDGCYVFFRYNDREKVMVVLNKNTQETELSTARLAEMLNGCSSAREVISGKEITSLSSLKLPPTSISIFELN